MTYFLWIFFSLRNLICWIQNEYAHILKVVICIYIMQQQYRLGALYGNIEFFIIGILKNCSTLRITLHTNELTQSQMSTYYPYTCICSILRLPCYSVSTKLSCRETVLDDFRGSHLLQTCRRPLIDALDTADMTEKPVC